MSVVLVIGHVMEIISKTQMEHPVFAQMEKNHLGMTLAFVQTPNGKRIAPIQPLGRDLLQERGMTIHAVALAQKTVPLLKQDVSVLVPYPRMPVMSVVLVIGHVMEIISKTQMKQLVSVQVIK